MWAIKNHGEISFVGAADSCIVVAIGIACQWLSGAGTQIPSLEFVQVVVTEMEPKPCP